MQATIKGRRWQVVWFGLGSLAARVRERRPCSRGVYPESAAEDPRRLIFRWWHVLGLEFRRFQTSEEIHAAFAKEST